MKRGLILEGGGMRGLYTAGVLDVLMENDVEFEGAVGVSAGAVFGCNYKSKQIGRTLRYNLRFCKDPRYFSFKSLIKTGNLFNEEFCYHEIPEKLDVFDVETFENNPMEFYVVCTDVNTGKAVYHKCTDGGREDLEWMRGSASMPLVSKVVKVDGYGLLDGGIADSIPVEWFCNQGYNRNLVVLTRPKGYRKKASAITPLMKIFLRKFPKVVRAMEVRHIDYNNSLDRLWELEEAGRVLVIQPSRRFKFSRIENNPDRLEALYNLGRRDGRKRLKEIKAFLEKKE